MGPRFHPRSRPREACRAPRPPGKGRRLRLQPKNRLGYVVLARGQLRTNPSPAPSDLASWSLSSLLTLPPCRLPYVGSAGLTNKCFCLTRKKPRRCVIGGGAANPGRRLPLPVHPPSQNPPRLQRRDATPWRNQVLAFLDGHFTGRDTFRGRFTRRRNSTAWLRKRERASSRGDDIIERGV